MSVAHLSEANSHPAITTQPEWMSSAQQILRDVLKLPREAREVLVVQLEESLDEESLNAAPMTDEEFRAEWADELNRRWKEYESGQVQAVPFDEMINSMRAGYSS